MIDLAADLECGSVIWLAGWAMYGTSQTQAWDWARSSLLRVVRRAEEKDVKLVFEPTPTDTNVIETADDAILLMQEADSPNVKLMFGTIRYVQE